MDRAVLAYLAGVIDSDGSIGIEKRKPRNGRPSMYMAKVSIRQVNPQAAQLARATFGGNICITPPAATQIGRHATHHWVLVSKAAIRALRELRPYLRIKGDRADNCFALDAIVVTRASSERPTRGRSRPANISDALEACYLNSKELNTRPLSPRRQPKSGRPRATEIQSPEPSLQ